MTCNNIKAAGITLYTMQVNTGGDPTSTLLQNCAERCPDQVLPADLGEPDRHDLQADRHQPVAAAHLASKRTDISTKRPAPAPAALLLGFRQIIQILV